MRFFFPDCYRDYNINKECLKIATLKHYIRITVLYVLVDIDPSIRCSIFIMHRVIKVYDMISTITVMSICPIRIRNEWSTHTSTNAQHESIWKQFDEIGNECIHDRRSLDMHKFALSPARRNTPVNNLRVPLAFGKVAKVIAHRESFM